MQKFIPFEKRSKKEQRAQNTARRGSWYGLSPVTRKPENSKAYNRKKARKWSDDSMTVSFVISAGRHFITEGNRDMMEKENPGGATADGVKAAHRAELYGRQSNELPDWN